MGYTGQSILERVFLVRPNEKHTVLYFLLFFTLTGAGIAIGKGAAEALFFKRFGIQYLPLVYIALSVMLAVTSLVYAALADRLPSENFFFRSYAFLIAVITGCWLLMHNGSEAVYPFFYLIYEVTSEILLIHSAVYVSQNFEIGQSKRIFALVLGGLQIGKITGGIVLTIGSNITPLHNMLLLWVLMLLAAGALLARHHRREGRSPYYAPGRKKPLNMKTMTEQVRHGLVFSTRTELTRNASFSMFFMVIGFYILWYAINSIYTETFETEARLGSFFGLLTIANGVAALLLQLFVTNRLIAKLGLQKTHLIYPVTTIGSYLALLFSYSFPSALMGSINLGTILPAIRNPARNLFFNVLPDYMQGRARALSMAIVLPLALSLTGLGLFFAADKLETSSLLAAGLLASLVYTYFTWRVNQSYMNTILATLKEKLFIPDNNLQIHSSAATGEMINSLSTNIYSENPDTCVQNAQWLLNIKPSTAVNIIQKRLAGSAPEISNRLLNLVLQSRHKLNRDILHHLLETGDNHLKATVLYMLFDDNDSTAKDLVPALLDSDNPRLVAAAAYGVWQCGITELEEKTRRLVRTLLHTGDDGHRLAILDLACLSPMPINPNDLAMQLNQLNPDIVKKALAALSLYSNIHSTTLAGLLPDLASHPDPDVRIQSLRNFRLMNARHFYKAIVEVLADEHPEVRITAAEELMHYSPDSAQFAVDLILGNRLTAKAQLSLVPELIKHGIDRNTLSDMAENKLQQARDYARATSILNNYFADKCELLIMVLAERKQLLLELGLQVLNGVENPADIAIIRAGLSCRDRRQAALAHEALRNLSNKQLADQLGRLLDEQDKDVVLYDPAGKIKVLLERISGFRDPWMTQNIKHTKELMSWT